MKKLSDKEIKKPKLMVCHGMITHPMGKKCKFCDKVKKEFEKVKPNLLRKFTKKNDR